MPVFTEKKHVFFDLDDTLWDFQSNSERVLTELFQEHHLEQKLETGLREFLEAYKTINLNFWMLYGKGLIDKTTLRERRFHETFKRFGYENENDRLLLTSQYLARAPKGQLLKPGCFDILSYLKPKYTLHIITNGFKEIQGVKIDSGGIRSFFDRIIISEEHGLYKPDERIFRLAEQLTGTRASECVMVGDNLENDVLGAIRAGWEAIHLDNEKSNEHKGFRMTELSELKRWL